MNEEDKIENLRLELAKLLMMLQTRFPEAYRYYKDHLVFKTNEAENEDI
jgi:hypothetical protein